MRKLVKSLVNNDRGIAPLQLMLLLLAVGSLTIPALLSFMNTGLRVGQIAEEKARLVYAADAGVDDAQWKIKNDDPLLPSAWLGNWNATTYGTAFTYSASSTPHIPQINDMNVEVTILPQWVLNGLETPPTGMTTYPGIIVAGDYIGASGGNGVYQITINYDTALGTLSMDRIAAWLPPGYQYAGNNNLGIEPTLSDYRGGKTVVWDFSSPGRNFTTLPGSGNKRTITFQYNPNNDPTVDFSWVKARRTDAYLSWDTSIKLFKITSEATDPGSDKSTTVTTASAKKEFQQVGGGINGDYSATGNTLMRDDGGTSGRRERLYLETSATLSGIPSDAQIERIFLYWSGWKCKPWYAWNLTETNRNALPQTKNVDKVRLQVDAGGVTFPNPIVVTADKTKVLPNGTSSSQHGWSYSCFVDLTDKQFDFGTGLKTIGAFFQERSITYRGNAKYTIRHWDVQSSQSGEWRYPMYTWKDSHSSETVGGYTRYPLGSPKDGGTRDSETSPYYESYGSEDEWAYAAWSVVIIYSSPSTKGHQLFVYDDYRYCDNNQTLIFTISGFLAPQDVASEPDAARLTCFVAEGDLQYTGDALKVNEYLMSDAVNPSNNVWNSKSNVLGSSTNDGIDIDKFNVSGSSGIIRPRGHAGDH